MVTIDSGEESESGGSVELGGGERVSRISAPGIVVLAGCGNPTGDIHAPPYCQVMVVMVDRALSTTQIRLSPSRKCEITASLLQCRYPLTKGACL